MKQRTARRYGWIPDIPDHRDLKFKPSFKHRLLRSLVLPSVVDMRSQMPPVYDQGDLGSCVGNAVAGAVQFGRERISSYGFTPSRLFIYRHARHIEGTIEEDAGCMIRDGIKTIPDKGVCPEDNGPNSWPYDISKFVECPPHNCWGEAWHHRAIEYKRLDNTRLNNLKACLASGSPFVFGFSVFDSFMSDQVAETGIVPMPSVFESVIGGHAVLAVGYDTKVKRFIVRNSWGPEWGDKGYFYMPFAYMTSPELADDFWTITLMKDFK